MAIDVGFFDAALDADGQYDRAYDSGAFTEYFAQFIGSGVCIYNNPDSMMVTLDATSKKVFINPGYLFIDGYWLKNSELYSMDVSSLADGTYAIAAVLNLGRRTITLGTIEKTDPETYPQTLVLAYLTTSGSSMSLQDTRENPDICGEIDSAGGLSNKVETALTYIDTVVDQKLDAAVAQINLASGELNATLQEAESSLGTKLDEANNSISQIAPPSIGTIRFSASQDMGEGWLRCDGSFISETQYPKLVESLGKLIPSGDKFQLISSGEIGPQISNGVIYGGKMWVYSYSTKKLYGVDLAGTAAVREIVLTSEDANFNNFRAPTTDIPIALSIVPSNSGDSVKVFLCQILKDVSRVNSTDTNRMSYQLIYEGDLIDTDNSLAMTSAINSIGFPSGETNPYYAVSCKTVVPYVFSEVTDGEEKWRCVVGAYFSATTGLSYLEWGSSKQAVARRRNGPSYVSSQEKLKQANQRVSFSSKNNGEAVYVCSEYSTGNGSFSSAWVTSVPQGTYSRPSTNTAGPSCGLTAPLPLNVVGRDNLILELSKDDIPFMPLLSSSTWGNTPLELGLPSASHTFVDAAVYLWGKDIYMIFVGTGIIFSRTLEDGSFGYLDTTSVLGTITQFGYLDYSQDEGTLYLLGQDTTNTVKVAKIVLNTLYDYANDGAWLPMIASDGVPAYIRAIMPKSTGPLKVVALESVKISEVQGIKSVRYVYSGTNYQGAVMDMSSSYSYPLTPGFLSLFKITINGQQMLDRSTPISLTNPITIRMESIKDYTGDTIATVSKNITTGVKSVESWTVDLGFKVTLGKVVTNEESGKQTTTYNPTPSLTKSIKYGATMETGEYMETTLDLSEYDGCGLILKVENYEVDSKLISDGGT